MVMKFLPTNSVDSVSARYFIVDVPMHHMIKCHMGMILETEYQALLKYCNNLVPYDEAEMRDYFALKRYIDKVDKNGNPCIGCRDGKNTYYRISYIGLVAKFGYEAEQREQETNEKYEAALRKLDNRIIVIMVLSIACLIIGIMFSHIFDIVPRIIQLFSPIK